MNLIKFLNVLFFSTLLYSCKKQVNKEQVLLNQSTSIIKNINLSKKTNPFSKINILKAKQTLLLKNGINVLKREASLKEPERNWTYVRFDPNGVDGKLLTKLESDSLIHILDFPFANGELYDENFAIDQAKAKLLADGKLYAVFPNNSPLREELLQNHSLRTEVLDELYLPDETDSTLQIQAFREVGYTEEQIQALRLCLFKRPSGFVRYLDQETNSLEPAPGMLVWTLVFGIPVYVHTDEFGYYRVPWRFIGGTIMGTKAKNSRVNIKPFNTVGGIANIIPQLIINFIVGSVHIHGWVGACQMRNDVDFNFEQHDQARYWAQLMHGVFLHDKYTSDDDIGNAPNDLVMYAHWADDYGNASAPLLRHVSASRALIEGIINVIFNSNFVIEFPRVTNLFFGLLPDVSLRVGNFEQESYSSRLMQTVFHELGHGSHFSRVGSEYWIAYINNIVAVRLRSNCGGYGCGNEIYANYTQLGESWAEFQGTFHALRWHPNGMKQSATLGRLVRLDEAIERERFFLNNWIPTGIFNDLMDIENTQLNENNWDLIGGLDIHQLYVVNGTEINSICRYQSKLLELYPFINPEFAERIFLDGHLINCRQ